MSCDKRHDTDLKKHKINKYIISELDMVCFTARLLVVVGYVQLSPKLNLSCSVWVNLGENSPR